MNYSVPIKDGSPWSEAFAEPGTAERLKMGLADFLQLVEHPDVLAANSEHGGYLLFRMDGVGLVWGLHALFSESRRFREATQLLIGTLNDAFDRGARMIIVHEDAENRASRPPWTFGFRPVQDFAVTAAGTFRIWCLHPDAWWGSPACRKGVVR